MRGVAALHVIIDDSVLARLVRAAWKRLPSESMAFLCGDKEGESSVYINGSFIPTYTSDHDWYLCERSELYRAWRWASRRDSLVLGDFHSHPKQHPSLEGNQLSRRDATLFAHDFFTVKLVFQIWPHGDAYRWWISAWQSHYPASLDLYIRHKNRTYALGKWLKIQRNQEVWKYAKEIF